MKGIEATDPGDKFRFLDEKTANEPHIYEVLNEILSYQMNSLPSGETPLATRDTLRKSAKIKIPFTTTRDRTVEYLIDILLKRFGHIVRPVVTFDFSVEQSAKQIGIAETTEYTILLENKEFDHLLSIRDKKSIDSLLGLLKKYRFFNLSKLTKKADEKEELLRVIRNELDRKIFTFKNYNIDSNKIEWAEDFCFHVDNYEQVKSTLNLNTLKEIISKYNDPVRKGLNKFGILNPDFSDYRDTKLAYVFSVLTDDLSTTISEKDMVDIKNIQSLISCLNRVDKVIDPVLLVNEDIVKFIKENKITTETEILSTLTDLNKETMMKWAGPENLRINKILIHKHDDGETYFIDGLVFFDMISEFNQLIMYQPEKMKELSRMERRKVISRMDIFYEAALNLLKSADKIEDHIKINNEKLQVLTKIVQDYEKYKKKQTLKDNSTKEILPGQPKSGKRKNPLKTAVSIFIDFIVSLFRPREKDKVKDSSSEINNSKTHQKRTISHETTNIYKKAIDANAPIVPLSDFVDLNPENDYLVNRIIRDMREHNLKIIIPVYNARKNLYPKRSQKLLIQDIEYLLISPDVARSPETIRKFTDSLVGQKLKDEVIPSAAVVAIEKYLLTLHRQKKVIK